MNIKDIAEKAHKNAVRLGKIGKRTTSEKLTDIWDEYSEASEALSNEYFSEWEGFKTFIKEDFAIGFESCIKDTYQDELTDLLFVVLTLMKDKNMDIEKHIEMKMKYNELREDHK